MKLNWPAPESLTTLTDHQRQQATIALSAPVGILSGCPGSGKTFTEAAIIRRIIDEHGEWSIGAAAPTGKAAVRLMATMQGHGVDLEAATIHRLLGVQRSGHDGKGWGFMHDADFHLPYRYLFLDEMSMCDTDLAAALFAAIAPGTHVLIVGDTAQLPPVGHGAPLRDLIRAGVPCGKLTEIRRNSGDIVRACKAISEGQRWQPSKRVDTAAGHNLLLCESHGSPASLGLLQKMLATTPKDLDPIWDVQVLCTVNAKSDLGRKNLNKALQDQLNPHGAMVKNNPFRLGDKVICTTNTLLELVPAGTAPQPVSVNYASIPELLSSSRSPHATDKAAAPSSPPGKADGREFVANGEIGRVTHLEEKLMQVRFDAPARTVKVPIGAKKANWDDSETGEGGAACDFDLAYAITVHRSQGSQWPVVIYMIDEYPGARMVSCRELVYTALSRAERLSVLIGKRSTIDQDCQRIALAKRKTFLTEILSQSLSRSSSPARPLAG